MMQEKLVWPSLESKGTIFPKSGVRAITLSGEEIPLESEGDFMKAERWSNGTIFALINGVQRRIHPETIDYVIQSV